LPDQRPRNYLPRLQDLQSREAHLCLKIDDFVRCELGIDLTASRLVLGISAGVDSMALAFWVSLFRRRWKAKVLCAHLDHGLRPEARQESDYAARLCADLGLNCHCGQTNTRRYAQAKGLGIEEAARTLRYRYLTGLLKAKGFDYLLTAHHLNDLAEDSLMRLIRGSGWPGQAGMPAWDQDRRILRPFLLTPKAHLRRLVVQAGIQWYEDQSNLDTAFLRNRVRSQLLPMFLN
jgi:tRNA(Ile)-lysidine synthase